MNVAEEVTQHMTKHCKLSTQRRRRQALAEADFEKDRATWKGHTNDEGTRLTHETLNIYGKDESESSYKSPVVYSRLGPCPSVSDETESDGGDGKQE
ncbi:MAG: hypothetical protein Q9207_007545 [Kuettlingeria erythrocarpa]